MKHMRHWLMTVAVLLCSVVVSAADFSVDGIFYNITSHTELTVEVTRGSSYYSGNIKIPSVVTCQGISYDVTRIGYHAFENSSSLGSVTIPNSITSIDYGAFYDCLVGSFVLESGNTAYDSRDNCNAIIETATNTLIKACASCTVIPNSVTRIGDYAFQKRMNLTSITIPNSVTYIGDNAFGGCLKLTSITIPSSVTEIAPGAFLVCDGLTSITCKSVIPPYTYGYAPFSGMESIPLYVPASSVEAYKAADGWKELTNIQPIPPIASGTCGGNLTWELTDGGELIIEGTGAMTTFPTEFVDYRYISKTPWKDYKDQIKKVVISEGVTNIEKQAFLECSNINSVVIPTSITNIGEEAFRGCSNITAVYITSMEAWCNIEFYDAESNPLCSHGYLYLNEQEVVYLDIPNTVSAIKNYAFYGANLKVPDFPNSVTSIGLSAFAYTNNDEVHIHGNITTIGDRAFFGANITYLTIKAGVNEIQGGAFCDNPLREVNCECTTPPTIVSGAWGENNKCVLYIPGGTLEAYMQAGWGESFSSIVEASIFATSLILDVTEATLSPSESLSLKATLQPTDVTNLVLSWNSNNEAVATVNSEGVVTAVGAGEAVVTVRTTDGSNLSATCVVSVATVDDDVKEYENTLLVDDLDARAGTQVELSVALKNNVNITNFQFDLVLPEGITIAQDEDGYDLIDLSTVRTTARKHTIGNELQNDGSMRVICYSSSNAVFSGTEGEVMTVKLNISESLSEGEYSVQLKNMVLTEYTDGNATKHTIPCVESKINVYVYTPGDVNDDGSIDVTDISGVVNFILNTATDGLIERAADVNEDGAVDVTDISGVVNMILNVSVSNVSFSRGLLRTSAVGSTNDIRLTVLPFTLEAGEEKEIQILLDNPNDAFTGVQFDLYLPEGVSVPTDEDGFYYVDLGSRTSSRKHVLPECSPLEDGGLRVVCYSNSNQTFKDEEGDILVISIVGDENLLGGVYELSLKNIVLSRPDVTNNKPSDYVASILSGDGGATPALALYGVYTADVLGDFSAALSTNKSVTSVDLTEAVSVAESGVLTTGNPNTLIYLSENASLANENNVVCGDECENLVLTDGHAFSTSTEIEAGEAIYTRTLPNMNWQALYVPFEIPLSTFAGNYDIAYINDIHTWANEESGEIERMAMEVIKITDIDVVLNANHPYLIRPKNEAAKDMNLVVRNTTLFATEEVTIDCSSMYTKFEVTGSYRHRTVEDLEGSLVLGGGAWITMTEGALNPFRLFLTISDRQGSPAKINPEAAKSISIRTRGEDDNTTDLQWIEPANKVEHVYDLQGRRVLVPQKGGLYIVNGKKVVY